MECVQKGDDALAGSQLAPSNIAGSAHRQNMYHRKKHEDIKASDLETGAM